MTSTTSYQTRIKKLGILKHAGIVFGALVGVLLFVVCFALYVWVNEIPRTVVGFTGFGEVNISERGHTTVFVAPDLFIGISKDFSEISYYRLDTPILDDSLRVFSKQNAVMVDGYIKGLSSTETQKISSALWTDVLADKVTSNITRFQLLLLSKNIKQSSFIENTKFVFVEDLVVDEELTIMVQNGTNISGLASEATVWVENIGGKVIEVGNASFMLRKTEVMVLTDLPGSPTVRRLIEIFGLDEVHQQTSHVPTRFDVIITIGDDFYGR